MKSKKIDKSICININNTGTAPTSYPNKDNNRDFIETIIKMFIATLIQLLK